MRRPSSGSSRLPRKRRRGPGQPRGSSAQLAFAVEVRDLGQVAFGAAPVDGHAEAVGVATGEVPAGRDRAEAGGAAVPGDRLGGIARNELSSFAPGSEVAGRGAYVTCGGGQQRARARRMRAGAKAAVSGGQPQAELVLCAPVASGRAAFDKLAAFGVRWPSCHRSKARS